MIHKSKLKGKYVSYRDKDGKHRLGKVVKITGNYLTVKDAVGIRRRIYKDRVQGRQFRKKGLEEIQWGK
jgi:hypothetical protein